MVDFQESFAAVHYAPLEGLVPERMQVFVDLSSVEVFVNDGAIVMTELVFPDSPYNMIASEGDFDSAMLSTVSRIWNGEK